MIAHLPIGTAAVLVAAVFLATPAAVEAGDRVHAASRPIIGAAPAPAPAIRVGPPLAFSLVVRLFEPIAPEPASITLRGPDGSVRRFAVEGGHDAIDVPRVVLRPGDSLTLRWASAKRP